MTIKINENECKRHLEETNDEKLRDIAFNIIGDFENWLESKGIKREDIPNKERDEAIKDGNDITAIIFGSDCDNLEDEIVERLKQMREELNEGEEVNNE